MIRKIYLCRHGKPEFPDGKNMCIGETDLPLSMMGKMQACLLGEEINCYGVERVFSSDLLRAQLTADYISRVYKANLRLREVNFGDWDGLTFDEIKEKWPDLYERRIVDNLPIPNAEDETHAFKRFKNELIHCLELCEGDLAIVAHNRIIAVFLSEFYHMPQQRYLKLPYCSYVILEYDDSDKGLFWDEKIYSSNPVINERTALKLFEISGAGHLAFLHCKAVAHVAVDICAELEDKGVELDMGLIYQSALLHDLARGKPNHQILAAQWLRELGYEKIADIVEVHHDYFDEDINEKAIVYIADKMISGEKIVGIEARFNGSLEKCKTEEAIENFQKRYKSAVYLKNKVNSICGIEIVV